jgi:cytochrome c peroxidase
MIEGRRGRVPLHARVGRRRDFVRGLCPTHACRRAIAVSSAAIAVAGALAACGGDEEGGGQFTEAELAVIESLSPLPTMTNDPTNALVSDDAAAALGQMLFFEPRLSGPILVDDPGAGSLGEVGEPGTTAWSDCHMPEQWLSDVRSTPNQTSFGPAGWTARNTPTLIDVAFYDSFAWDGYADSLWMKSLMPVEVVLAGSRLQTAHVLFDHYRAEYDALFSPPLDPALAADHASAARFPATGKPKPSASDPDGAWEGMSEADRDAIDRVFANAGKALDAYQRRLVSGRSPFDDFAAGSTGSSGRSRRWRRAATRSPTTRC